MPRLLDYLNPIYAWLAAIDPSLPRALFVALVFGSVLLWRKVSPSTWLKFSSLINVTDEDTSWFKETLRKLWQAVPSAALGAIYGALGTGGDVWATLKLALLGLAAPVIHEVAWRYKGNLGKPKPTAEDIVSGVPLLVLLFAGLFGLSQQACGPALKLPCDNAKLNAIDADYMAKVSALCLPKFDRKEDCPEWPALKADHKRRLNEECGVAQ